MRKLRSLGRATNPIAIAVTTALLAASVPSRAGEAPARDDPEFAFDTRPLLMMLDDSREEDELKSILRLGMWAISIDGDVAVGPIEGAVDADFDDLIGQLNFGLMGGVEV